MKKVKKAIIPAVGLRTSFLRATKEMPKKIIIRIEIDNSTIIDLVLAEIAVPSVLERIVKENCISLIFKSHILE